MGLDIWFREDILNALKAAEQASATTAAAMENVAGDPRYLRAYREGYRAALVTVATAFGIAGAEDLKKTIAVPVLRRRQKNLELQF